MPGKLIILLLLLCSCSAVVCNPTEAVAGDYLILETEDPPNDQKDLLHQDSSYPGGDLLGARLLLRKVLIHRGSQTDACRPGYVYIPIELTIRINRELRGGEVQLCIFCHLPPLHIEHIISRDSTFSDSSGKEIRVLLAAQSEISLFTGMEESWDKESLAFKNSEHYQNCFFETNMEGRAEGLRRAAQFNFHSGTSYQFPPSPHFYWRDIPSLSVSTSLVVREIDGLTVGPVQSLVNDTLEATWREVTEPQFYD